MPPKRPISISPRSWITPGPTFVHLLSFDFSSLARKDYFYQCDSGRHLNISQFSEFCRGKRCCVFLVLRVGCESLQKESLTEALNEKTEEFEQTYKVAESVQSQLTKLRAALHEANLKVAILPG